MNDDNDTRNDENAEPLDDQASDQAKGEAQQPAEDAAEDKLRRAMADLANLRKRQSKELLEARSRAIEGLSGELLPVLDNFHLALGATDQVGADSGAFDANAIVDGLKMVRSLLEGVLERHGLTEITAEGKAFDPNMHEAVGVEPSDAHDDGAVLRVMQRGYMFGERVLRPSRVIVAGQPDTTDKEG